MFVIKNYIMNKIQIILVLLNFIGITIISYKGYASQRGWNVIGVYDNDSGVFRTLGAILYFATLLASFFYFDWYKCLIGALIIWLCSGLTTAILREKTQYLPIVILLYVGFILLK